jgi:hypothetical protein
VKISLVFPAFGAATRRLWNSPELSAFYPEYLSTMHTIVRSSVPLMRTALDALRTTWWTDPIAPGLTSYSEHHIPEELGHDQWILEDLQALGRNPAVALDRIPSPAVANLVGSQYYWVRHYHPVCLLGHIAIMEGYPPAPVLIDELIRRTGFPRQAFRSLRRHATLDVRHRDDLFHLIDSLPLQLKHTSAMGLSALHTVSSLVTVFEAITEAPSHDRTALSGTRL